jgi:hypothetical protein
MKIIVKKMIIYNAITYINHSYDPNNNDVKNDDSVITKINNKY